MVDEDVGTDKVETMGVYKLNGDVGVCSRAGVGFPESGVDAANVASRFEVGVGGEEPKLQARMMSRSPLHK